MRTDTLAAVLAGYRETFEKELRNRDDDDLREVIRLIDSLPRAAWKDTNSVTLSARDLLKIWFAAENIGIRFALRDTRPITWAGIERKFEQPARMRAARSKRATDNRRINRERAERALAQAGGDAAQAAKIIGKSEKTLNRWLCGK